MRYSHQTAAERAHSAAEWAALVFGAMSPDPLPEEEPCFTCGEHECRCPVDCPECEGTGVVAHPRGHEAACGRCWGDCTIPAEDVL
jgi:DnaJ-class molecular chaperone